MLTSNSRLFYKEGMNNVTVGENTQVTVQIVGENTQIVGENTQLSDNRMKFQRVMLTQE